MALSKQDRFFTTNPYCLQVLVSSLESEAHRYEQLGIALRVPYDTLLAIGRSVGAPTVQNKFAAMIQWWLLNTEENRPNTWDFLVSGIKRCKNMALAQKVESCGFYQANKSVNIDLIDLLQLIKEMTSSWKYFGTMLCVPGYELDTIDQSLQSSMCLKEVLVTWIRLKGDQATLGALTSALRSTTAPNKLLANKLEQSTELSAVLQNKVVPESGQDYVCIVFYCKESTNKWRINFVIVKNDADLIKNLKKNDDLKDAEQGSPMKVLFQTDQIVFNGMQTSVPGWDVKIQSRKSKIALATVKEFDGQGYPPSCVLTANKCTDGTPPDLKYEVALDGAKPPDNKMVVERKAEVAVATGAGMGAMGKVTCR